MKKRTVTKLRKGVILLKDVTKRYIVHHEKPTFSENLMKFSKIEQFTAIDSMNLTIYSGERLGIIGSNGSGKTTLLKLIGGITAPSSGTIKTVGKIVSLIDLGAGFHPDLSGQENIFLNALVIGMTREEVLTKKQDIISYADIGSFIDAPLYTYSEGMKLRLGFSIAIHSSPDILILDEGMSVGDTNFQEKSSLRIKQIAKMGKTVVIVSHWLDHVYSNCTRVIELKHGKIINEKILKNNF